VLFAVVYLLRRRLVRLLANSSKDLIGDVEVVVLRHQLMVQSPRGRPRLRRRDLLSMAAMSRTLPRVRWVLVRGQPTDASSLAPGVGEREVDVQTDLRRRQAPRSARRPAACLESRELRRTPSSRWRRCSKTWASHPERRRRASGARAARREPAV
jgi:hypothetical protein